MTFVNKNNAKVGMKVRRGPSWMWGNQDCDKNGKQCEGVIINIKDETEGWVRVKWNENIHDNIYRITCPDLITDKIQLEFDF